MMVCEECKKCSNYMVCENGCYGSDRPCEYLLAFWRIKNEENKIQSVG